MSCNYFKLSLFSIVLCILIITHKFYSENVRYNKKNTDDVINTGYKRLLSESQETNLFNTHSRENSLTYPMDNKLEEDYTEYDKTSSTSTLNDDIHEEPHSQTESVEFVNENNNKSLFQKSNEKSHCKIMKKSAIVFLLISFFPISLGFYIPYYTHNKNKKKNLRDQISVSEKNIDSISVY